MKIPRERLRAAAVLGAASGVRSLGGPAALALRGKPRNPLVRGALLALAGGEAVADKLPIAPPRSDPPALAGRVVSGIVVGAVSGGRRGAAIGASLALASTYASERGRALLGERTGLPDPAIAVAEDTVVYGSAWLAAGQLEDGDGRLPITPPGQDPAPAAPRAALAGLAASLIGTAAMTSAQTAYGKITGAEGSETPRQVGEKILGLFGRRVADDERPALNNAMHVLYGTSWGAPYGLLARRRPGPASGLALGAGVWAISLAELPALGVAPPPWKQSPADLAIDLGFHLVYGFATGAAFDALSA